MGHPTHPATVHFPIAFMFLTGGLDAAYFAAVHPSTANLVGSALKTLDVQIPPSMFPILSYYTTLLTLLFSVPAVISGAAQLMPVIKRDGLSSKKAQTGVLHALVNDVTVFATAYNWWTRRNAPGFKPDSTNILVSSVLALPATLFAAYLGGSLVYKYGMGVGGGSGRAKKTQ
ncbi:hypothetical protein K491DRAFT_621988 [Lophiostoma macrostomum CBS 122681]|uniref:DUF2231 domain-containing protein n=1 Tax=Lophiostoma macrostomum CBS 122681 TaxID=1314788 RepID=A0A6A6TIP4_9PLEO|nr:hypothetical protein K491DRAFT_621988 [Lophiostoma macrostomum CBS 122681]